MTDGGNTQDAQRWVDECEKHEKTCQDIMIGAAAKCAPYKVMIRECKSAFKETGGSVRALTAVLLVRKHLRNAAAVRDKLDDEDLQNELDMLRSKLAPVADMPLFGAAIAEAETRVKKKAKSREKAVDSLTGGDLVDGDDNDDDLRPPHLREKASGISDEDAARIMTGITPLN